MQEKAYRRHVRWYKGVFWPCRALFRLLFGYRAHIAKELPPAPYMVLANHTTDVDPILVGASFPQHMYFVAGESVFRMGLLSRFLSRCFAPIQRIKGSTDAQSALSILRTLKAGHSVCLFPEGNKTFTGRTLPIHPATAKLVKSAGCALITYRITGGYFTVPRWSGTVRRGRMTGGVVCVYPAHEIKQMSVEQIARAIQDDLALDAYALQKASPIAFRGRRLAEKLETALYLCPRCGKIGTLHSKKNRFYCDCGLSMTIDAYGFFKGVSIPFETPDQWDQWQDAQMHQMAGTLAKAPAFIDEGQTLYRIGPQHELIPVASGKMALYADRFVLGGITMKLSEMTGMALVQRDQIVLSCRGEFYTVASDHLRSGRKYVTLYDFLKEKSN